VKAQQHAGETERKYDDAVLADMVEKQKQKDLRRHRPAPPPAPAVATVVSPRNPASETLV
jgi:hypothetical protein